MRFGIETRFGITADVYEVTDPWDAGLTLGVLRYDSREHRDWLNDKEQRDPLTVEAMRRVLREEINASKPEIPAPPAVPPPAADGAAPEADSAAQTAPPAAEVAREVAFGQRFQEARKAAATEAVNKDDFDPFSVVRRQQRDRLDEAISLLKWWRGVTDENGVEVALTALSARELLTSDVHIPDGEHVGKTLGEALVAVVFATSLEHAATRAKVLEGAESNVEPSSAGN